MWEVSMSSYISYIIDGIWEAKQCILSKSFRHLQEDSLKLMT